MNRREIAICASLRLRMAWENKKDMATIQSFASNWLGDTHGRLSRYHALTASEVRSFFGICRKRRGERLRLRSAGDTHGITQAKGSETAIKPERPKRKIDERRSVP